MFEKTKKEVERIEDYVNNRSGYRFPLVRPSTWLVKLILRFKGYVVKNGPTGAWVVYDNRAIAALVSIDKNFEGLKRDVSNNGG